MKRTGRRIIPICLGLAMAAQLGTAAVAAQPPEDGQGGAQSLVEAFENGQASIDLTLIGRYSAGQFNVDGGVMEIVAYNADTGWAYAVNGQSGLLTAISLENLGRRGSVVTLDGQDIDVRALVEREDDSFQYGDMTSVAVSPDGTRLAAALQAEGYADAGRVALFTCGEDGSVVLENLVTVGVQPDMVTFADNGTVLTADEGEPRDGYGDGIADPKGSVSVVDVASATAEVVTFDAFDSQRDDLVASQVVLKKDTAPSVDLEPEYIAVSGDRAYVTLQENNAVAVLDLTAREFTGVYSVGFEDYSQTAVDIDKKDDAYAPKTYETLLGIRMPDGIAAFEVDGTTYLVTANEGDAREWGDEDAGTFYLNEDERDFGDEGVSSPTGAITTENSGLEGKVVFFRAEDFDGLDQTKDYLFGGRTFTVYAVGEDGLTQVFTSGDDFEALTWKYLPDYYNCSNDNAVLDDRSGKKGPEAESVTVGQVDGHIYAFVALERTGGVMVYDVTDPADASYVNYINSRDFASIVPGSEEYEDEELDKWVTGGDVAPEGLAFLPAAQSPTGTDLLLAACEVSGTVAVYELIYEENSDPAAMPFTDVDTDDWFYDEVFYVWANGLMDGVDDGVFDPDGTTSRAMVVTILWRLEGEPDPGINLGYPYADVEPDSWYTDAVYWARANGIVDGVSGTEFAPGDPITREQFAAILYRYAAYKGYDVTATGDLSQFPDGNNVSDWAVEAVEWAVSANLLQGDDAGLLPSGTATRAQSAALLMRFCQGAAQ